MSANPRAFGIGNHQGMDTAFSFMSDSQLHSLYSFWEDTLNGEFANIDAPPPRTPKVAISDERKKLESEWSSQWFKFAMSKAFTAQSRYGGDIEDWEDLVNWSMAKAARAFQPTRNLSFGTLLGLVIDRDVRRVVDDNPRMRSLTTKDGGQADVPAKEDKAPPDECSLTRWLTTSERLIVNRTLIDEAKLEEAAADLAQLNGQLVTGARIAQRRDELIPKVRYHCQAMKVWPNGTEDAFKTDVPHEPAPPGELWSGTDPEAA